MDTVRWVAICARLYMSQNQTKLTRTQAPGGETVETVSDSFLKNVICYGLRQLSYFVHWIHEKCRHVILYLRVQMVRRWLLIVVISSIALVQLIAWNWNRLSNISYDRSSNLSRGVRYAKSKLIRYFIDIDILQNSLIDIDIFKNGYIDIDIFQISLQIFLSISIFSKFHY